jgi:LysM repeat protein
MRSAFIVASLVAVAAPALPAQVVPDTNAATARAKPAVVKHTVKRGDTLWDIARAYLKDPFRWPDVFHANTDIVKNPHWIYPGQVLVIDGAAVKPEVAARADSNGFVVAQIRTRAQAPTVFSATGVTTSTRLGGPAGIPPALTVRPGEYAAAPYVVDDRTPTPAGKLIGPVDVPALGLSSDAGLKLFDRVYISSPPGASLRIGDNVVVARTNATITDVGRVIEPTGVLRIDSIGAGNRAVGVITAQFAAIVPGQAIVLPGQSFESTTVRPIAGTYPLTAKLLWIQGSPKLPSVQAYVVLAATQSQGVRMGDQFTLLDDRRAGEGAGGPLTATAAVTIVRVTPYAATGIVVHQSQPEIRVGMPGRLSARMP